MREVWTCAGSWSSSVGDLVSESVWLCAAAFIPLFFNVESARHFEPDKAVSVRLFAIAALTIESVRALTRPEGHLAGRPSAFERLKRSLGRLPLAAVALVVFSTIVSTALSVAPRISAWGSYERRQGAYTVLSYVVLFVVAATRLDRVRVARLVTVIVQTAAAVSFYALVQVSGHDPIAWVADVTDRATSTFGNAGTIARYLVVAFPFVVVRLACALRGSSTDAVGSPASDGVGRLAALVGTHLFVLANVLLDASSGKKRLSL